MTQNFYVNSQPYKFDNFEVLKFFKPYYYDSTTIEYIKSKNKLSSYNISFITSCKDGCGKCFQSGKYYLVYGTKDSFTGLLSISGCHRTRIIEDGNFAVKDFLDPNKGENELEELNKLIPRNKNTLEEPPIFKNNFQIEIDVLRKNQQELKFENLIYKIIVVLLILLAGVLILKVAKAKKTSPNNV